MSNTSYPIGMIGQNSFRPEINFQLPGGPELLLASAVKRVTTRPSLSPSGPAVYGKTFSCNIVN